jgi:hypothetical protein
MGGFSPSGTSKINQNVSQNLHISQNAVLIMQTGERLEQSAVLSRVSYCN